MAEQLIGLGLLESSAAPAKQNRSETLMRLVERLLELIAEPLVKSKGLGADEFCSRLREFRVRLSAPMSGEATALVAEECFELCRDYYGRASTYLLDREAEFNQVILFLRKTVGELATESSAFQDQLQNSSERLVRLSDLSDIRQLKQLLADEVSQLKDAIADRHKQEEATHQWMNEHIRGLETKLTEARAEASLDGLTGVANRRSFDDEIIRWAGRYRTDEQPFAMALLDLDDFKVLNDTHGHLAGDFLLRCAAGFLQRNVRATDFVARYGGEEFVILLGNITLRQAEDKMNRVLSKLAATIFEYEVGEEKKRLGFTASCGLAECSTRETQWELIMRADGALYEAKKRGKNRVVTTW